MAGGFESSRRSIIIAIILICCASTLALTLWAIRALEPPDRIEALEPRAPFPHWREIKTGFLPEQLVWAKPTIRINACIFAQFAVRHALEPAQVEFHPCNGGGQNIITLDDDYYEATVSGAARVNGKLQSFKVTLNHYPPATSDTAFIATDIQVAEEATALRSN